MIMCKKVLGLFLIGTLFFFCSCVDDTYDLKKEITTSVEIKDNKLTLPLGSLQAIMLDSLMGSEGDGLLSKEDGVFGINMSDSIAPYTYEMPEIKFSIPTKRTKVEVSDFAKAEITKVHIEGQNAQETKFDVPSISLSDLEIPSVNTDRSVTAANDQVKEIIGQYGSIENGNMEDIPLIPFEETFTLNDGEVDFNLSYTLPKEIETLYTIYLKKAGDNSINSQDGALIGFEIIHPIALTNLDKEVDFTITFPDEFIIGLDPEAEDNYVLSNNGHTIKVEDLFIEAGDTKNSEIRFYIKGIDNLDSKIINGNLSFNEVITYEVEYNVEGMLQLQNDTKLEDFNFYVVTDLELAFRDVVGKTKEIEVDFTPITMDFNVEFNNLEHIDRIEYIDFYAQESKLHFHTEMEGGFSPFTLKEGYALKLKFPDELLINEALSAYPRTTLDGKKAVEYKEEDHAFYIYNLEVFNNFIEDTDEEGNPIYYHWALALDRFDLHEPVVNGEFHHNVEAEVTVVNNGEATEKLVLAGTYLESMNTTLESLQSKKVDFKIWNSDFKINDAVVHTEKIISKLEESIAFDFSNNDLPKEICRIEGIGFRKKTPVYLDIKINGLEELDTCITLDLHVKLPSALKASAEDNENVKIIGDTLFMTVDVDPQSTDTTKVQFMCEGLDFTKGAEGNVGGIKPEIVDGKGCIEYNSTIDIVGEVIVNGSEFHSTVLEKDVNVDVDFVIPDIEVKDFHGIFYIDNIGGIEENFALDFGEGLDFLMSENNSIVLSDPQISISVNNAISIPISAGLSLIGKDANGQVISTSVINTEISIDAAQYDSTTGMVTPRTTNLLISAKPKEVEGYTNLHVENLSNLLKQMPASIDIALTPVIDTTSTQHINLIQPLSFSGSYKIDIPFQFDEFNFVYSDTIAGLNASLGEMMEMFSNVSVGFKMNIKNSMPLQLQFKATPLDEMGDTIHGLTISEFEIPAGAGLAYSDTIKGKDVHFKLESDDVSKIAALDKLKFDLQAKATSTEGGVALRGDQGIKLDNIAIEVKGDVKIGD